jgi:DNA-binding NarL/FixJ family response regulator
MTTAAIAKKLFRSRKTIEAHRLSMGAKLGVRNRVELARIALEAGLLSGPPQPVTTAAGNGDGHLN